MKNLLLSLVPVALLALCGVGVLAQSSTGAGSISAADNDVNVLNFALTLERLELAFYTEGQTKYNGDMFKAAGYSSGVYEYFNMIKAHEQAHVNTLVTALGSSANGACTKYVFGLTSVADYVSKAITLESTGVSAYDGAINGITSTAYQQVAATIATIEARHTSYLMSISNSTDGPFKEDMNGFDTPKTPTDVIKAAAPFIDTTSCPFDPTKKLPIVRPGGVATMSTLAQAKPSSSQPNSQAVYTQAFFNNDLAALNYALTLEHLEAAFYADGQGRFTKQMFQTAYGSDVGATYYNNFVLIKEHEAAHVAALTTTINGRQASTAVPACTYDFSTVTDVKTYVATAKLLENTGVMAYDGAVNTITDTGLQQIAATIATVEAKHAAFLNGISGTTATNVDYMSGNFDNPVAPADVLTAVTATKLITSCPYTPAGPAAISAVMAPTTTGAALSVIPSILIGAVSAVFMFAVARL